MENTIYIKNMVCPRCVSAVKKTFTKLNIPFLDVKLGEVIINPEKDNIDFVILEKELQNIGFELINDKDAKIINQIKSKIIKYIHHSPDFIKKVNYSDYLSDEIGYDYSFLSKLFSSVEAKTIEKYIILQKIERAKELLSYNQLSLSEISYQLEYSSVQHLSSQFKKITGFTPSAFKKLKNYNRKRLDEI